MHNNMTSISNEFSDAAIHNASILDIPFIFDLIVHGSLDGSFTDSFLSSKGYIAILVSLFTSVLFFSKLKILKSNNKSQADDVQLLVFTHQDDAIGFLQIKTFREENGNITKLIDKCAIKDEFRGQGLGKNMINLFLATQSSDTKIFAYCNKYAKSMQRIFRHVHFRRTSIGRGLNLYTLGKFEQKQFDTIAERHRGSKPGRECTEISK
jgi:RimJ/RimL family protein N-acetyltransferase